MLVARSTFFYSSLLFSSKYDINLILAELVKTLNKRGALGVSKPGRRTVRSFRQRANKRRRTARGDAATGDYSVRLDPNDDTDAYKFCIKRGNRYITFQTEHIRMVSRLSIVHL